MDPNNMECSDIAKYILASNMPLNRYEDELVKDVAYSDRYIYWGESLNAFNHHHLRILFWMAVGYMRRT